MKQIRIGANCSLGVRSVVASGANIPEGTDIGPLSSSYELLDAHQNNRVVNRANLPSPAWYFKVFVGWPIFFVVEVIAWVPIFCMLFVLTTTEFYKENGADLEGACQASDGVVGCSMHGARSGPWIRLC
jgi:hypothetical protein